MQSDNLFGNHLVIILFDIHIVSALKLWFLDVADEISIGWFELTGSFFFPPKTDDVTTTAPLCLRFRHMLQGRGQWLLRHPSVWTLFASQPLTWSCWHLRVQLGIDGQLSLWPVCLCNCATALECLLAFSFCDSFTLHIPPLAWRFSVTCRNNEEPLDVDLSTLTSPLRCECRLVINWPC